MADAVSIAVGSRKATDRLIGAANQISSTLADLGVQPLVLPPKNRDPNYWHMAQLVALAAWMESLAQALTAESVNEKEGEDGGNSKTPAQKSKRNG